MIIELVGPPGAGKTAIATALATILRCDIDSISSRKERAWHVFRYGMGAPLKILCLLVSTLRENWRHPSLFRYKLGLLAGALARTSNACSRGRYRVNLIDEGLAQYSLTLSDRDLEPEEVHGFFHRYVRCDVLLLVMCKRGARQARMAKRERVPRSQYSVDQEKWQAVVERNAQRIGSVQGLGTCLTITTDDMAPHAIASEVVDQLRKRGLYGA